MTRPSIILLLSDDQGAWAMGCAGNREIRTPTLDRLAAEGARFRSFFCTSPVCSPARASILTGRMPSQHGVHDWIRAGDTLAKYEPERQGERIEYLAGQPAYTDFLAAAGYVCGLSGKWHLGDCHTPQKSFSYWKVHTKGGGPYYRAPMVDGEGAVESDAYVTDLITDNALAFLHGLKDDAPFYLGVHYTAPHAPWTRENHPAATYDDYLRDCPFASTPDERHHPWSQGNKPRSTRHRREMLSGYFTAVTEMDRNIGRVLEWLDAAGKRDNTLILFTSDNGMNMGHHGIYGKGNGTFPLNLYDTSVKVPALLRWPAVVAAGTVSDAMLSHVDILPTLLDAAGCPAPAAPPALPGRSFLPILSGRAASVRDEVVICDEYGPVRMIRTTQWKYVHRYPYGPHELYDLRDDPDERYNLVAQAEHQERAAALRARLQAWFAEYSDPRVDGRTEPVTGMGQLGLAGLRGDGRIPYRQR